MELRAITYNYTQDGIVHSKVVGIFKIIQLKSAFNRIISGFGVDKNIISSDYDESTNQFFLEFDDTEKSYFYSGTYVVGEMNI